MILDPQDLLFLYFICPCIFGYECPQIASGWGWKESDKGDLLSAHFLMSSSLWGNKPQGMKHRPLAQLGHSGTLCATYWAVNITWLITLFSPRVNISSLFSCLALWKTKGNVSPDKLGMMTFWAGQLLVSGHMSPRCLKPQIFFLTLSGFPLPSSFQPLLQPLGCPFCVLCFHSTYCHFSQLGDLRFGESM